VERSSEFRASDQQRERAALELREHFAAGRITQDELESRRDRDARRLERRSDRRDRRR
jgi:hypothetical protein